MMALVVQDLERKGAIVLFGPGEDEWQYISLEDDGHTDGTLTTDSTFTSLAP